MKKALVLSVIICGFSVISAAQEASKVTLNGNAGLYYDYYQYHADNYSQFRPRFPQHFLRFSAGAVVNFGSGFSLPFAMDFTNQQQSQYLPNLPEERFLDYVQNPRNNIRISPTWGWFRADLGTHTPSYSSLTTGDIPLFGAGIEMKPGKFLFSANYGRSQMAVNADPFSQVAGAFEQWMFAARIGAGQASRNRFVLNFVHLKDDLQSIDSIPAGLHPRAAFTISPELQIRMAKKLFLRTETAVSLNTTNQLATGDVSGLPVVGWIGGLFPVNISSFADISNISSLEWRSEKYNIGTEVRYLGAGFLPAGFRVAENDLVDYNLKTGLRLLGNRLIFNGTGGLRITNLSETKLHSTRRLIANTNLFAKLSEHWSLSALYTNFGYRNNVLYDTLRVEMIQQMASLIPSWQYSGKHYTHTLSGGPSLQYFNELNAATGENLLTRSESASLNYQIGFKSLPLSLGFNGLYLENKTPMSDLNIIHTGISARYRFNALHLTPSLSFSYAAIRLSGFTPDDRIRLTVKTDYRLKSGLDLGLAWNLTHYDYGSRKPEASTLENRIMVSVLQHF
jgi:hypothetical protein